MHEKLKERKRTAPTRGLPSRGWARIQLRKATGGNGFVPGSLSPSIFSCTCKSALGMLTKVLATNTIWHYDVFRQNPWKWEIACQKRRVGGNLKCKVNPGDLLDRETWSLCDFHLLLNYVPTLFIHPTYTCAKHYCMYVTLLYLRVLNIAHYILSRVYKREERECRTPYCHVQHTLKSIKVKLHNTII